MKIVGICKTLELAVRLRLGGIDCQVFENGDIMQKLDELKKMEDLGIIVIDEELYKNSEEELNDFRRNNKIPLIVRLG